MDPGIFEQTLIQWGGLAGAGFAIWKLFDKIRQGAVRMNNIERDIDELQKDSQRQAERDSRIEDALANISTVMGNVAERMAAVEVHIAHLQKDK